MTQEQITPKAPLLKELNIRLKLIQALILIIIIFSIYLMISIISFYPFDPSWSYSTSKNLFIHNIAGKRGAWLADVTLLLFGIMAYGIPLETIFLCGIIYSQYSKKEYTNYFSIMLRVCGAVVFLITSCSLIELQINDYSYFSSGGILGFMVIHLITKYIGLFYGTFLLLIIWCASIILYIGYSWISIIEKIGILTMRILKLKYYLFYVANKKNKINLKNNTRNVQIIHPLPSLNHAPCESKKNDATISKYKTINNNYYKILTNTKESNIKNFSKDNKDNKENIIPKEYYKNKKIKLHSLLKNSIRESDSLVEKNPSIKNNFLTKHFIKDNKSSIKPHDLELPKFNLLSFKKIKNKPVNMESLKEKARLIETCLSNYHISAKVVTIVPGPVIIRFELRLAPGLQSIRIVNLSRDLARELSVVTVRVVENIPGKPYVGLDLPNPHRQIITLHETINCSQFHQHSSPLTIALGKDIAGLPVIIDLAKMPHLLIAGTTGSGKSVAINSMIISILYKSTPETVRFIMIDPKMLELSVYNGIPHLLQEVVTDMQEACDTLNWCIHEMEERYMLMSKLGVRNILSYNEKIHKSTIKNEVIDTFMTPSSHNTNIYPILKKLPYIVIIVEEFADLMMTTGKKTEKLVIRLVQKARAAGIHLILATQRPSVNVITGLIKANISTRIALTVASKIDSRTILDQGGAELLLGMGDMLYMPANCNYPIRVHGAFVLDEEVHAIVKFWKEQHFNN